MKQLQPAKATDAQLLIRFQESRDQDAFGELVRRHGPMVFATARRVLRSEQDVEDAFQATMFALAKATGRLRRKAAVAGWLHKTAFRCAIEIRASNVRWKQGADRMTQRVTHSDREENASDPSKEIANEELETILDEELAGLTEKLRDVIVLCDLEGLPQKQVAMQLGIPTSTLNDRIERGRKLLRKRLIRRGATLTLSGIAAHAASSSKLSAAMTKEFIADVSAKATLFATGKAAAEIGVSSTVVQIANKVNLAMTKAKVITILLAAVAIVVSIGPLSTLVGTTAGIAGAQMILIDNFDNGNDDGWTRMSQLPPESGPAIYDPSSGAYQLKSTGLVPVGAQHFLLSFRKNTNDPLYSNGYLRGKVRVDAEGTIATLMMRARVPGSGPGYLFAADTESNQFFIQGGIGNQVLARMNGPDAPTFNVGEDWNMEGGAIGDRLTLKVWKVGESEPSAPQLEIINSDFSDGELAVAANVSWLPFPEPALVDATFDDIYFTPVPEPTGASLATLVVLSLVLLRRRAT